MCVFTGPVERVSDTSIYARAAGPRQVLVYGMEYAASRDLAMVLPIPVPPGTAEEAVQFLNLENCPHFFSNLQSGFRDDDADVGGMLSAVETEAPTLVVHDVGSYEASFVPSPEDFGRLDERFRLPAQLWPELGRYRDWGFAVFKLKPTAGAWVHPMAFEFPRRDMERLFFPTLHVHRGCLDSSAVFDHALYCQVEPAMNWHLQEWDDSNGPASSFVFCEEAARLMDLQAPCWRVVLEGERENRDTWLGAGEVVPRPIP